MKQTVAQRINTPEFAEAARSIISERIASHAEWFCTLNETTQSLNRRELDVSVAHGRLVLNCWTEKGSRVWKIFSWQIVDEKLLLHAARKIGTHTRPVIELVPRSAASAIALTVKAARQARCEMLGKLVSSIEPNLKCERCALSPGARRGQPGKYARIVLRQRNYRIAVTGSSRRVIQVTQTRSWRQRSSGSSAPVSGRGHHSFSTCGCWWRKTTFLNKCFSAFRY